MLQWAIADMEGFDAELASMGQPWGSDDLGMMIGEVYQAAYAMMMNCLRSNLGTIDGYTERLVHTADSYDAVDTSASADLQNVQNNITSGPAI
jgi:hypothetical protein